ncbi:MAG: flagellar hook-length control protein FliK [Desulfobacterales bacterium]|nr:flagellar hook-length control protein FliK [Desulfobacterales bacterium]
MDLTFSDINGTLLNMFQGKMSGPGKTELGPEHEQFLSQLNRIIQEHQSTGSPDDKGTGEADLSEILGASMGKEEGIAFLNELKSLFLTLSNGNLENLSLNGEGLDALGQLLAKAGFDSDSIDKLMADLSLTLEEGGEVTVSDFMDKLFELPKEEEVTELTESETLLATSDVPYMYSLLKMLGIDEEKTSEIMSQASRGNQGISLDSVVEMLRELDQSASSAGLSYQTESGDDSYLTFLEQLGLKLNGQDSGRLTLAGLISSLEQKQTELSSGNMRNPGDLAQQALALTSETGSQNSNSYEDLFGQLFKGLEISNSAASEQASHHPDLVTDKIREQYKNEILNPVQGLSAEEGRPDRQPGKRIDPVFLAGEANQDGRRQAGFEIKGQAADIGEKAALFGKAREELSSSTDINQVVQSTEKTSAANSLGTGNLEKTRQTFNSLPNHVTQQVGKNIVRAINLGENTLRLQLKPAELGRVFMTIDNNGDSMKVSIITENQSAKEILASNVNEIKTILSSSGISLDEFEVDMSSDFRQSMADARGQGKSNKRKAGKAMKDADELKDEKINNLTTLSAVKESGGALHFVA